MMVRYARPRCRPQDRELYRLVRSVADRDVSLRRSRPLPLRQCRAGRGCSATTAPRSYWPSTSSRDVYADPDERTRLIASTAMSASSTACACTGGPGQGRDADRPDLRPRHRGSSNRTRSSSTRR